MTPLIGEPHLDLIRDAPPGVDEVKTYAPVRLAGLAEERREKLAATIAAKSQGNFLFAYHVLNQLVAAPGNDAALDDIPDELEGVYRAFLKRELDATGELWSARFRPLLGTIAVARDGTLTKAHLAGITLLTPAAIDDVLRICREYLVVGDTAQGLRLYHYSFQEFLLADPDYNVYPAERHEAIAAHFLGVHGKSWRKCQDLYALRYTPFHLGEAARGSEPSRDTLIRMLVELTENVNFQGQCVELLRDLSVLEDHFTRALATAALSDRDEMLPWIARSSKSMAAFRRKFLTSESVLAPARAGDIDAAEGRLAMFTGLGRDWRAAASLIIAWLAHDVRPTESRTAVDRLAPNAIAEPLPLLVGRIRAAQNGAATYPAEELSAETPDVGVALIQRLSGQAFNTELLASRGMNVLTSLSDQTELIEDGGYASTMDGPVLVNSARVYGEAATANVDAYIDAHAGYNYVEYRNNSLWVVLHAVLRHHPQQDWVRDRLARILGAALTAGGSDFTEMAPVGATALRERAAGTGSPIVDTVHGAATSAIEQLKQGRGANDSWSVHRRRLTMLMEIEVLVRSNPAGSASIWSEIRTLEQARVLDGFAGFRAPAELRLADAMRLCGQPMPAVEDRLIAALRTARHIQDYHFCARITARCNALRHWHDVNLLPAGELVATIQRFVAAPADVEFAAEHAVGESFEFRGKPEPAGASYAGFALFDESQMLPVRQATQANSLDQLADVFQRPVLEFVRLNPKIGPRTTIGPKVPVHVPDPGLAPLLACHFSARVLAETSLGLERAGLIRSLLPVALANATAFDTVLAYLLIATDPEDVTVLDGVVAQLGAPVLPVAGAPPPPPPRGIPA